MSTQSKAYMLSLSLYAEVCSKGQLKKVTVEQYSEREYKKVTHQLQKLFTPEQISIVKTGLLSESKFTAAAVRLMCRIIDELKLNNALWWYESRTGADKSAIALLRREQVIFKTEDPDIHLVNPEFIRRGTKPAVLALTVKELQHVGRVSQSNIRNLGSKSVDFNMLDTSVL